MTHLEYNGWWNYETWAVNLWMSNDQGSSEYWAEQAQTTWGDTEPGKYDWQTKEFSSAYALGQLLKEYHEEQANEFVSTATVFSDLLNAALSEVNWQEIAKHLIADVDKGELDAAA